MQNRKCGHKNKKACAWANTNYHIDYPNEEQYAACFKCNGLMNKGAYQGEQSEGELNWNIHHKDSNPKNNQCINLVATHPECNRQLG